MKIASKSARSTRTASALKSLSTLALAVAAVFGGAAPASATPFLGSAQSFAVLGASTVTNTGSTTLWGDLGLSPGPSVTGFAIPPANTVVEGPTSTGLVNGPGLVAGTIYISDAVALQARIDARNAWTTLSNLPFISNLSGSDLGTVGTLMPGVYKFNTSAQLTGTLTLDALNDPNALFVFQIGTTLTTASNSTVSVLNGGINDGVFWEVGSSATLGTSTSFAGNILADQSVTLNTTASILCGRAIALTGAVTLDTNTISNDCLAYAEATGDTTRSDYGSVGFSGYGGSGGTVPEPGSLALLGLGLAALGLARRRHG